MPIFRPIPVIDDLHIARLHDRLDACNSIILVIEAVRAVEQINVERAQCLANAFIINPTKIFLEKTDSGTTLVGREILEELIRWPTKQGPVVNRYRINIITVNRAAKR